MRPFKGAKTQKEADDIVQSVQKFWRDAYGDYQEMMGREVITAQDQNIALHFSGAMNSVEKLAKELKSSGKNKRGKDDKRRE